MVEDNTQIRSLSHSYADLVALWTVSSDRAPLSTAPSARQNAQIVKREDHTKPSRDRSPLDFQDIPRRKIPSTSQLPLFTRPEMLSSSPDNNAKFQMPRMDDSSSPLQASSRTSGFGRDLSEGSDGEEIVVMSRQPLKRKRAASPEDRGEVCATRPRSYIFLI